MQREPVCYYVSILSTMCAKEIRVENCELTRCLEVWRNKALSVNCISGYSFNKLRGTLIGVNIEACFQ